MSGSYTCPFGERMKAHPRRPAKKVNRAPLWIRMRYSWTGSGAKREKRGPWMYFYWTRKLSELTAFTRSIESWRQVEYLGKERPMSLNTAPCRTVNGVELFLERL